MADIVQETIEPIEPETEGTSQDGTNGLKIEPEEDEVLREDAPAEEEDLGLGDDEVLGDEVLGDDDTPLDGDPIDDAPINDAETLADDPTDAPATAPTPNTKSELKEKMSGGGRKGNRFHPYKEKQVTGDKKGGGGGHRNRVFISNIPYDTKWQAIKDLMREKGNPSTHRSLLYMSSSTDCLSCSVVEFKDEEFVKKAIEVMNKYDLNGRPLNIMADPDGERARRVLQRTGGLYPVGGGRGQEGGPGGVGVPPSIANNPNVPHEVISSLRVGRLGTTVFVANLDFKVGWKKLKEVFGMAGTVKRADVKEDKDGKSRGMGTVTFEQALEAVQAISMFNGQMLFDRQMHVKMDDKSMPADDFHPVEKAPQLPREYTSYMSYRSGGMGGGMDRDFGRSDMSMSRGFGDSFGGMGGGYGGDMSSFGMGPIGGGLGGMGSRSMERMGSGYDRMGGGMAMSRGFGGYGGGAMSDRAKGGCQIFVRNLSYDLTWQKLKEKFSACGQVMFAEIKMEGGKSKGCGTVRFDSPESANQACRMMNGTKISGREVDVRIDRNA
uniref:Myelin expression factor 2 n=1 Tax=Hucho hucho TaxID=62062 RepID=A0A4W5PWY2_9TELE